MKFWFLTQNVEHVLLCSFNLTETHEHNLKISNIVLSLQLKLKDKEWLEDVRCQIGHEVKAMTELAPATHQRPRWLVHFHTSHYCPDCVPSLLDTVRCGGSYSTYL